MSTTVDARIFRPSQRAVWAEGQPISALMHNALSNPNLISLAAGFVDQQTLPAEAVRTAFAELFSTDTIARDSLQYGSTSGCIALREWIRARALETDGLSDRDLPLDRIVVTAGSNQLLHLVVESLLDVGDIVLCASPTYLVFLGTLANLGARAHGIAADDDGMIPSAVEEALRRLQGAGDLPRVKAIYLVPYFDNPRGVTMPIERVAEIVEIAKCWSQESHIHVIADEAYRELRYTQPGASAARPGTPLEAEDLAAEDLASAPRVADSPSALSADEDGDTVIVAGTFSKSFSPGLRIGWGLLPAHLVEPVCNQKGNIDFGSPNFTQNLMARVLQRGLFDTHVTRIRAAYETKMRAMLAAADEFLTPIPDVTWTRPCGGLYVWVQLPAAIDTGPAGKLLDLAVAEGVLYVPGEYCYPSSGEPVQRNTIRLSFGVQSPDGIRRGIEALARAINDV